MFVSAWVDAGIAGVFGLLVGSFLNVVIYRLPRIMAREWWAEVSNMLTDPSAHEEVFGKPAPNVMAPEGSRLRAALDGLPPFSLARPRSRCPSCGHAIRWYENIPVISYLALRGKCSACEVRISVRYPLVELVTGGLFALIAARWGLSAIAIAWAIFAAILIVQFLIDFDTQLLPDDLNYPLLWLGLLVAALGWTVPLDDAVWGAVWGYMSLWLVYQLHNKLTGKEGMGAGDFKLLAALGAWFGAHYLVALILLSSIVGSIVGGSLILVGRLANKDIPIPFGPFIAGAGLVAMVLGSRLQAWIPFAFPF
jgi:leader peptidase (prepilin peptidase) / N-methyltransferase